MRQRHISWRTHATEEDRDLSYGKKILSSVLHAMPRLKGHMYYATRALKGWTRNKVVAETEPWPEEAIILMAVLAMLAGHLFPGLCIANHFDCGMREQDVEQLLPEDIHANPQDVALRFEVPERGDSAKAGIDQGAVVRRPWIARMLRTAKLVIPPTERVYQFSMNF